MKQELNSTTAKFTPSPYQQALFDWVANGKPGSSAIVKAVAGSGKTTSIKQCLPLIPDSCAVQLFAFNKEISIALQDAIEQLKKRYEPGNDEGLPVRFFRQYRAGTFHSVCFNAVRQRLKGKDVKTDGQKMRKLCRQKMSERDNELYSDFVCKLVGLAKGEGIGALVPDSNERWWDLVKHHDLTLDSEEATEEHAIELSKFMLRVSCEVAKEGNIDFDDMLYLVCLWKLTLWQNDWVFVDEAQDTNPVRRAIAKLALKPGGRLMAVGDERQAIYGFTGASHDAMDLIKEEFNCIELPLSICYRCSKSVVEYAKRNVAHLEAWDKAPQGAVHESMTLDDAFPLLDEHSAVLCRNTSPLIGLAYHFIASKKPCKVLGREIGAGLVNLINRMKAKTVAGLIERLEAFKEREVASFMAKGEEQKAEAINDRFECVMTVIAHLPENRRTIPELISNIEGLFSDTNGCLTLSTCHKAKGKEYRNVAILEPRLMPSKWARQDWQVKQEYNLIYVAETRAQDVLMYLSTNKLSPQKIALLAKKAKAAA